MTEEFVAPQESVMDALSEDAIVFFVVAVFFVTVFLCFNFLLGFLILVLEVESLSDSNDSLDFLVLRLTVFTAVFVVVVVAFFVLSPFRLVVVLLVVGC